MNEINVQTLMRCSRLKKLILLNKKYYKQINLKDIHKQYTMNEINVQNVMRCWKGKKIE